MEGIGKEESQSLLTIPGFVAPAVLPGRRVLLAVTLPLHRALGARSCSRLAGLGQQELGLDLGQILCWQRLFGGTGCAQSSPRRAGSRGGRHAVPRAGAQPPSGAALPLLSTASPPASAVWILF